MIMALEQADWRKNRQASPNSSAHTPCMYVKNRGFASRAVTPQGMSLIALNSPKRKLGASHELFENKTADNLKIFVQLLQQKYFWFKQQRGKLPVRFTVRIPGLLVAWCSGGLGTAQGRAQQILKLHSRCFS